MSLRACWRGLLAGPLSLMASGLLMAGAALYLPGGAAGIDNIVLPILLFPLIWCLLLLYALLDERLLRASAIIVALGGAHLALILDHLARFP